jgi:Terminase-like family.
MSQSALAADIDRRLRLARDLQQAYQRYGLLFYRPHPAQDAFHRAGDKKHRMYRAGNRSGKSTMGCAEDSAWLIGERPWYPRGSVERTLGIPQHPVKGKIITTDWDKVNEIWTSEETGKIWRMLPRGFVTRTKRNHSGAIEFIATERGSSVMFDTVEAYKKNPQSQESSDLDFLHIDEPCPEGMYKANARGLMDRNGKDWFTLTPLQELWINDMFFPQPGHNGLLVPRDNIFAVVGNTRDNPYLTEEAISDFESSLTEDERQCRLNGLPLELAGLVYKEFKEDTHILKSLPPGWKSWDNPPADHTIYCSIDVHPKIPHAVVFCAVGPSEVPIIYDEIWMHCDADGLAAAILHKLRGRKYIVPKCDPLAWIQDPITLSCMAHRFAFCGLPVVKASKAKEFGILKFKSVLKDPRGVRVAPTCYRWLWEIRRYCYDPKTNKPVDEDDHMMEATYRLFINSMHNIDDNAPESIPQHDLPLTTQSVREDITSELDWSLD